MRDEVNPCRLSFWQLHWCGFFSCPAIMRVIRLPGNKVWRMVKHSSSLCYSTLAVKYAGLSNQFLEPFAWEGDWPFQKYQRNIPVDDGKFWITCESILTLNAHCTSRDTSECIKLQPNVSLWFPTKTRVVQARCSNKVVTWSYCKKKKANTKTSMLSKYHVGQF